MSAEFELSKIDPSITTLMKGMSEAGVERGERLLQLAQQLRKVSKGEKSPYIPAIARHPNTKVSVLPEEEPSNDYPINQRKGFTNSHSGEA